MLLVLITVIAALAITPLVVSMRRNRFRGGSQVNSVWTDNATVDRDAERVTAELYAIGRRLAD